MDNNVILSGLNNGDLAMDIEISARCLFCGNDSSSDGIPRVRDEFFKSDCGIFNFHRCNSCGSLWLGNRPAGKRLLNAYANYYTHDTDASASNWTTKGRNWARQSYLRSRLTESVGLVDRFVAGAIELFGYDTSGLEKGMRFVPRPPARLLDYGCGSGIFLQRLQALGFELHGAEYDPHLLSSLAGAGIAIHDVATLAADQWDQAFDHITLSHVLEHVPDPLPLLSRLFGWLKPGGGIYVEVPNADATGLAIFGRYWRGLEAPRHFSLPNQAALVGALESVGFIVECQQIDRNVRQWIWNESLRVTPQDRRSAMMQAMSDAPPETENNAEILTFLARRPV